jgi:glucose-1-phosphate adenylyltransferase
MNILAMIMAGGEGKRLHPLTTERSKPSVPFGGRYRLVDFVLSNLINSGIHSIYLLVQYKSQSLIEHIRHAWLVSPTALRHFVTVVPPQMLEGPQWFQGTADAVYQNLDLVRLHRPDFVAVFGADHIYRMDVAQMAHFQKEHEADVAVAAIPVPLSEASSLGVISADVDGLIDDFQEKPLQPHPLPNNPAYCYASMGNYLFKADVLEKVLIEANAAGEKDFGRDIIPRMIRSHRVFAYDFGSNHVPGLKPYEETGYWRDVGTIDSYHSAHRDVLGLEPRFNAFNPDWPIYSSNYPGPATKIIGGEIDNSIFGGGTVVNHGKIRNSIIRREVFIDIDVEIEDSIIMDYCNIGRGARLRRVIFDRYNNIPERAIVGYDKEADARRYHVSPGGIVVARRGRRGHQTVY